MSRIFDIDMHKRNDTDAVKPGSFREWVRIRFFSGHLKVTLRYEKVLDLCCGWGFYLRINPKAHGVDIDPGRIDYLRVQGFNVTRCDVVAELPFPDADFDLVLAHDALEHFTYGQAERIFKNVFRLLKKNGVFMIVIPNRKGYEAGLAAQGGHAHCFTYGEIAELAGGSFAVAKPLSYPLPRVIGRYCTHNKEIFILKKIQA